jgi:Tol biopolymer transport system component
MRLFIRLILVIFGSMMILLAGMQHLQTQANAPQGWLLYSATTEEGEDIYRLWGDGTHQERLTDLKVHANKAIASSDRQWIYFHADQGGRYNIYRMGWDGANLQVITEQQIPKFLAHVSADGRWIYFLSWRESASFDIYRMHPDGSNIEALIALETWARVNSLHFVGEQIVFTSSQKGDYEVFVMDLQSLSWNNVTQSSASEEYPNLSPDGEWVVYSAYGDNNNYDLHRVRTDGSYPQQLTHSPEWETYPMFSTDGKWIFFIRNTETTSTIYRMRADGSHIEALSQDGVWAGHLLVSADGKWLFFSAYRDGNLEIYRMQTDGSALKRLTHNGVDDFPNSFISLALVPAHRPEIIAVGGGMILGGLVVRRWRK